MAKSIKRKASSSAQDAPALEAPVLSRFKPGTSVAHPKFGKGTIVGVDGNKLTIQFKTSGMKIVMEDYVILLRVGRSCVG